MRKAALYILLVIFAPLSALSQDQSSENYIYNIKQHNVENGLSHNSIYNLTKDNRGNVLVLTRAGLDIISFGKISNISILNHNFVFDRPTKIISKDHDLYWLATPNEIIEISNGIPNYIKLNEQNFTALPNNSNSRISLFQTENQQLFALTKKGSLIRFQSKDSIEVIIKNIGLSASDQYIYNNVKLVDNRWLYITQEKQKMQLFVVDLLDKTIDLVENPDDLKEKIFPIKQLKVRLPQLDTQPTLSDFLKNEVDYHTHPRPYFPSLYYDSYSKLFWHTNNNVLYGYHPSKGVIHQIDLPKIPLNYIMEFTEGTIWLSTTYDGIYQIDINKKKFETIPVNRGDLRNIIKDQQNHIWMAGRDIIVSDNDFAPLDTKIDLRNFLVYQDYSGHIWTTSFLFGDTLFKYDNNFNLLKTYNIDAKANDNKFWTMVEDKERTVWIAASQKLIGIQSNGVKKEIHYEYPVKGDIYHLVFTDEKHLWLCTQRGLYLLNLENSNLTLFNNAQQENLYLPAEDFHHLYIDRDSIYWLATGTNGLIRWDRKSKPGITQKNTFKVYNTNFGMPSNIMHAIYEDKNGYLWISSEYGIIQFHKRSEHFRYFLERDGIINNEFNRASYFRDGDGYIYFGGVKGLTKFNPEDFIADTIKTDISIVALQKLEDKRYRDYLITYLSTGKIKFNSVGDFFNLKFGTNNTSSEDAYRYFYAYDRQNWIPNSDYTLDISNLAPGEHTLYLKKENLTGDILDEKSISISVPKPYYQKLWFYSLVLLALIITVYLIFKVQNRRHRIKELRLENLINERTQKIKKDNILIRQQAQTLEHLFNKKSSLFKNIAHELRNPLTLIFGATKILESQILKYKNMTSSKKYLDAITSNSEHILSLTDEVLYLARLEANTEEINDTPISLFLLLEKIVERFKVIADFQNKELVFIYDHCENLVLLLDAVKIEKIISNLLSNAFKYTPKGATITFKASKLDERLSFRVTDTGYGISKDELPLIFEPYYRSERITEKYDALEGTGGTGIGLSIVKKLTNLIGGEIQVNSKVNEGSIFNVNLPYRIASLEQQEAIIEEYKEIHIDYFQNGDISDRKKYHILIVDDHPGITSFLKDLLDEYYFVSTAPNGKAAVEILTQNYTTSSVKELLISLVISDIMMPELDGIKFTEQLKSHVQWKLLPVIFLTGYNDKETKQKALRIGIEDYLIKPFNPNELLSRIHHLLSNSEQRNLYIEEDATQENYASYDDEWLGNLNKVIQKNIQNSTLNVDFLADEMAIGKRQLNRKIKQYTGLTPGKYIQEVRLQQAKVLLENRTYFSVSEVAYTVGFKSPKYFSKQFRYRFGRLPSDYLK